MIEVNKIVAEGTKEEGLVEIQTLDFVSDEMLVFNLVEMDDGTVIDGKFSVPKWVQFLDSKGKPIDWTEIVEAASFKWNNQRYIVRDITDPKVEEELSLMIMRIPLFDNLDRN
jgi:hypothetical protein